MFLKLLRDTAADPEADDAARRDWGVVRDWLGAAEDAPLTPAQHEQWAQAFERYVAEGQAPSLELAAVFERFRQWLPEIYRSLRDIAPEIPPELRAVMERLLATEEQIATARMGAGRPSAGGGVHRQAVEKGLRRRQDTADDLGHPG